MTLNLFLLTSVFVTALISGATSLAGGQILMGIFGWVLPVSVAMILHGITQTASNIGRALFYWRHIHWPVLGYYFAGAAVCTAGFAWVSFVPNQVVLFLLLGLMPFANFAVPKNHALDISRRGHAVTCGVLVSASLLTAGVSGTILDAFYMRTKLTRFQIMSTKGVTQTVGHLVKIGYFAVFLNLLDGVEFEIPTWIVILMVISVFAGIFLARRIVHAVSDHVFRTWTQWLTMAVGVVFLWRGVTLWVAGS